MRFGHLSTTFRQAQGSAQGADTERSRSVSERKRKADTSGTFRQAQGSLS